MRSFTLITASLALIVSVHAAAFGKRAVSTDVQNCLDNINKITSQTGTHATSVSQYTISQGYTGAVTLQSQEQVLEGYLNNSTTICCAISTTVNEDEATAVENAYKSMSSNTATLMTTYVDKKPQFDSLLIWSKGIIMKDIEKLKTQWTSLDTCVVGFTPSGHIDAVQGYANAIEKAAGSAFAVYNATNTTETVSTAVETCRDNINAVAGLSASHAISVPKYNVSQGYTGALALQSEEQNLEKSLNQSITSCCSISSTINHSESAAVQTALNYMAAHVPSVATAYADAKPQFDALLLWNSIIKNDLKNLNTKWTSLDTCLINFTPSDDLSIVQGYADTIKNSLSASLAVYNVTTSA